MALRDGPAILILGDRNYVPVKIKRNPKGLHQPADVLCHLPVPRVSPFPQRPKDLLQPGKAGFRNAVDGHVADARLIRIVQLSSFHPGSGKIRPALHAAGRSDPGDFPGLAELHRSRDGVVIHDSRRLQALVPGAVDRRRRGIGRKGINRVDMIVGILGLHLRVLLFPADDNRQVRQTLLRIRRVQKP